MVTVAGLLYADPAGALYWPDERLLVVADLHLEKGSAFAARGVLLPPYDTAATLARLAASSSVTRRVSSLRWATAFTMVAGRRHGGR